MPKWIAKRPVLTSLLLLVFFISGCNSPDPTPELRDPIYLDIQKQEQSTQSELKAEENALVEAKVELSKVQPQTGQIKHAQRKMDEIKARIVKLDQQISYLGLRKKSRELADRKSYSKAFSTNAVWPDPKENIDYKNQRRLELAPRQWNVKQRMIDAGMIVNKKKAAAPPASSN